MKILSTFMLLLMLTNCAGSNMAKVKFGKRCTAADENGLKKARMFGSFQKKHLNHLIRE